MTANSSNIDSILSRQAGEGSFGASGAQNTPSFSELMQRVHYARDELEFLGAPMVRPTTLTTQAFRSIEAASEALRVEEDAIVQAQLDAMALGALTSTSWERTDAFRYVSTINSASQPRTAGVEYSESRAPGVESLPESAGTLRISGGSGTGNTWIGRVGPELTGTITSANLPIGRIGVAPSNTITSATIPATPTLTMSEEGFEALKGLAQGFRSADCSPHVIQIPADQNTLKDEVTGVFLRKFEGSVTVWIPGRLKLLADVLDGVTLEYGDLADPKKSAEFFRSIAAKYAELAEEAAEEKALEKDVQPGTAAGTSQMDLF